MKKSKIKQSIKSKDYWPEGVTPPQAYRAFYWTPDYSFCGFATNSSI